MTDHLHQTDAHDDVLQVAHAPGAERLDVVDGAIVEVRIVFDRLPFERARHHA